MLVYGIRCPVTVLSSLPPSPEFNYYMEYGLLEFAEHTRPTYLENYGRGPLTDEFVQRCKVIATGKPIAATEMNVLEHPYISEDANNAVRIIRELYPTCDASWFHVPFVAGV